MINLFTGWDPREATGWHVFASSVLERCSLPVALMPLTRAVVQREGTNAFTFSRFCIPWLRNHRGWALFVDGVDMLCRGDLARLWEKRDPAFAVQVVKHDYQTRHPRKYVGTPMETANQDYPRKNWASVMLINCGHPAWKAITPQLVERAGALHLLGLRFLEDEAIGSLGPEWNWLADEHGPYADAQLLHWTAGVPGIEAYRNAPEALAWAQQWLQLINVQTPAREAA